MRVGMIGLGLMGAAMAANLVADDHEVVGTDVAPDARERLTMLGGRAAETVAEVVAHGPVTLLSLPTSDHSREVCLGPAGIAEVGTAGIVVVDTTTARPADSERIGTDLAGRGIGYLDATLSGNSAQAARADLVAMVGGAADHLEVARPALASVARAIHHVGPIGAGARTKLVVNLVLGIHRMALAEGLLLGELSGIELDVLLGVLRDSAAYSRAMDIWGERMVSGEHTEPASRIRQSHKDFRLILEAAQVAGAPSWLSSTVRQLLQTGERTGLGELDNSAVVEILRRQAGIGRHPLDEGVGGHLGATDGG